MYDFYKEIKFNSSKSRKCFENLVRLYKQIPETTGCLENIVDGEGCKARCCLDQNPQVMFCEFLRVWSYILTNWSVDDIFELIEKSMLNYIKGFTTKGCVFFDEDKYICKIHEYRCLNCYLYGITPEEEFKPRFEKLKKEFDGVLGAVIRDQCNLVKTKNDEKVTVEDTNRWFQELEKIENEIGIKTNKISDGPGGSYRTYHDHILLMMVPEKIMMELQYLRLTPDFGKKIMAVHEFVQIMKSGIKDANKKGKDNKD